jgi:2'-5' RNA ligase
VAVSPDGPGHAATPAPVRRAGRRRDPAPGPGRLAIAPIRSFVAILLPAALRARLGAEIERLRATARGVGWIAPENLHLTLKFLGGVEPARLEGVAAALGRVAAAGAPFDLALHGLGAFPASTRPRILWGGVGAGAPTVVDLAARVDEALATLGFAAEARPFSAHVTLGRVREPRRNPALAAALDAAATLDFGLFTVEQIALMRSDLSPRGACYTCLESWPLGLAPNR